MDCSPPGSSIHGIFQARVVEWAAIAFSKWGLWGRLGHEGGALMNGINALVSNGTPLHYSCLENPMDGGAWWLQSMGSLRVGHD